MSKPYYQDNKIQIFNGHVITELRSLPDEAVHCVVLSPPYWGLRDYGLPPQVWDDPGGCEHEWGDENLQKGVSPRTETPNWNATETEIRTGGMKTISISQGQFCQKCNAWRGSLGLEPTPELYIQHIVQVFKEIWRVGRPDCTVWLNLGDSFASGKGSCFNPGGGETSLGSSRKEAGAHPLSRGNVSDLRKSGLKPKDLCGIPWAVAKALQQDGWWLRRDIIWFKLNPMPESCTDRPTSSHEYVFLLTKSGTPKFWTHRDQSGTRTKPKADYRWVNQITDEEVDMAPGDWKDIIICPNCQGTGIAMIDLSCEVMGQWLESWVKDKCPVCDGKKKVQKWKRINLWRGHDYFYDADAVREDSTASEESKVRYTYGRYEGNGDAKRFDRNGKPDFLTEKGKDYGESRAGRNLRSVWTIATQPFKNSHFATFPEALVTIPIKAGSSEKGCCPECGAPWVRVVEKKTASPGQKPGYTRDCTLRNDGDRAGSWIDGESKTIGWRPSCECKSYRSHPLDYKGPDKEIALQPIPCTVLDPFGGSGRTAIVAKKLGRKCIIIELKPEYCSMPLDELRQENIF